MALWACRVCTCRYSVGAPGCPQCGASDHYEEGEMPKITKHGGPSDATAEPVEVEGQEGEVPEGRPFKPLPPVEETEGQELVTEPDYDQWAYGELQAELKERGLAATGTKTELIERLEQADREQADSG